jgi:hypothetical protein
VPVTETKGCLIGRVRDTNPDSPVTYSDQIARILQRRCLECHREGQIGPFAMTEYEDVAGWGEMIAEVVYEQRMPPWHANPKYGHFSNDQRMTEEEKRLIYDWVEQGCPEGNPDDLPEPPEFHEGWYLPGGPDQVFHIAEQPVPVKAEGVEPYRYYEVDPGFTEDKWVRAAEVVPLLVDSAGAPALLVADHLHQDVLADVEVELGQVRRVARSAWLVHTVMEIGLLRRRNITQIGRDDGHVGPLPPVGDLEADRRQNPQDDYGDQ